MTKTLLFSDFQSDIKNLFFFIQGSNYSSSCCPGTCKVSYRRVKISGHWPLWATENIKLNILQICVNDILLKTIQIIAYSTVRPDRTVNNFAGQ